MIPDRFLFSVIERRRLVFVDTYAPRRWSHHRFAFRKPGSFCGVLTLAQLFQYSPVRSYFRLPVFRARSMFSPSFTGMIIMVIRF